MSGGAALDTLYTQSVTHGVIPKPHSSFDKITEVREMTKSNTKEIVKKTILGVIAIATVVIATTLILGIFSGGSNEQHTNKANADTTKHARVVLNGQVVKEGRAKGYDYHAGMNGHTMTVKFEDGTEATSSPNNMVVWSE